MNTNAQWISSAIIYQVNLRGLAAREPRNPVEAATERPLMDSPIAYLTQSLSKLKRLGFNTVYLLPPYPIGRERRKGIGSPYASRDFYAVEPEYGTLEEMKALIRRAHALRLKVIFDITPNHTARDHVWITEHPEYYVKAEDGSAFYDCDWSDTAKLDYHNPALCREMAAVYDYWLSILGENESGEPDGIDGFRLDMAHFINRKEFWDDTMPVLKKRHAARELLFLAECYGFENNLDLFGRGIAAAYDDDFYKFSQYAYAIGPDGRSVLRLSGEAMHNHGFHRILDAWQSGGPAAAAAHMLMQYENASENFPVAHYTARYTDNHDEGRGLYRFGAGAMHIMNTLAFLAPKTIPFLLCGQEFGALNRPPIHERCSPCDKGYRKLGDDGREWKVEGVEFEGNIFARELDARQGWYEFYKSLITLRKKNRELTDGSFEPLDIGEEAPATDYTVLAFDRKLGRKLVRCVLNLGHEPRRLARADHLLASGQPLWGEYPADGVLPAFSAFVTRLS